ncbi:hypothetical protein FC89_GL001552 [Liquorilactobacillus ghanensis DSM 18630]|uniref:HTH cro/C1-type domain-containing protein n=1 Tax=Liquorilactobacillus ghanensis DSM 18630 TaxID=1423750 RepID=A0A0R1VR41_9LACO|nr:helix-turn-helix transcriptional regulator [Liquorilactobacillus ghanensis]KRM08215.1 hypothetical protein FC89_GL001552 [Liquorilactobacillus ghanensis DSM 18630]
MRTTKLDFYIKSRLNDPEFKEEYDKAGRELDAAVALYNLRQTLGLSQRELAELAHRPQSTIARIENGNMSPTLSTLQQIAAATGKKLKIEFV